MARGSRYEYRPTARMARTYQLSRALIARIDQASAGVEAWPSDLVELLLAQAFAAIDAGEWELDRIAVRYQPIIKRLGVDGKT